MPFLTVAAPRPGQDQTAASSQPDPDTPMHHAHRGANAAAMRHRLLRAAQFLLGFMLVVAAGTWLFVKTDHLHLGHRRHVTRIGTTRYLLPDGSLSWEPLGTAQQGQETLFREAEFGLSHYAEDYDEDHLVMQTARQRWTGILDPLTVQSLAMDPAPVDKAIKIVILTPRCCEPAEMSEEEVVACHRHVMKSCPALAPSECFRSAAAAPPCRLHIAQRSHRLSYLMGLKRLVPFLEELSWSGIEVHRSFLDSDPSFDSSTDNASCAIDSAQQQAAQQALSRASLIIADAAGVSELLPQYPKAMFIAADPGDTATLSVSLTANGSHLTDDRVRSIWRAQAMKNEEYQNGPLLLGTTHLAFLPGAARMSEFRRRRRPLLPYHTITRIQPFLSHAFRYRYPLDCGGNFEHLRFAGAFLQNFSHWQPPRTVNRSVDIAFIGQTHFGGTAQKGGRADVELLTMHRDMLMKRLNLLKLRHVRFNVLTTNQGFKSYSDYLAQLRDVKILVSPYGAAEWSEQDLEAVLSGCLLVKVNAGATVAYPDLFRPKAHVLPTSSEFSSLEDILLTALQDMEHAQRMADRTTMVLLEYSDMRRYAGDIDVQLTKIVRNIYFQVVAMSGGQ